MEERRCFNYRGRETNSFVREKERDPRAAATEEARTSAEGIRKREMMVASFLAKIISSRKESASGESGAVPWKPGFFERRSLFLSLSSFFSFYFKEAKPLAKPFSFQPRLRATGILLPLSRIGTRGSRVEFNPPLSPIFLSREYNRYLDSK